MPSRPFDFSEFYTKSAADIDASIDGNLQTLTGDRSEFSGSPTATATAVFYTDDVSQTVPNGAIMVIDSVVYEIVFYEKCESHFANYAAYWLKTVRE
jgi:hypothetical protein